MTTCPIALLLLPLLLQLVQPYSEMGVVTVVAFPRENDQDRARAARVNYKGKMVK